MATVCYDNPNAAKRKGKHLWVSMEDYHIWTSSKIQAKKKGYLAIAKQKTIITGSRWNRYIPERLLKKYEADADGEAIDDCFGVSFKAGWMHLS